MVLFRSVVVLLVVFLVKAMRGETGPEDYVDCDMGSHAAPGPQKAVCRCPKTHTEETQYKVYCNNYTNSSSFPIVNNTSVRNATTFLLINRSNFTMVNICEEYPNLKELYFNYIPILNWQDSTHPFKNCWQLEKVGLHWANLTLDTFEKVLCNLPGAPGGVELSLRGVFQGPDETNLTANNSTLSCLNSDSHNLTSLEFSSNDITIDSVKTVLCHLSNTTTRIVLGKTFTSRYLRMDKEYFSCLSQRGEIDYLRMKGMRLFFSEGPPDNLTEDYFHYLSKVNRLSFYNMNAPVPLTPFMNLTQLTELDLGDNGMKEFDVFTSQDAPENLHTLILNENLFQQLYPFRNNTFKALRNLTLLGNHGAISSLPSGFVQNIQLQSLDISSSHVAFIEEDAFRSSTLEAIVMNSIILDIRWVSPMIFRYTPMIKNISMNYLNRRKPTPLEAPFVEEFFKFALQNLTNLTHLSLISVGLNVINKTMFEGTTNLHTLDLSDNSIYSIDAWAFTLFTQIKIINLDNNQLLNVSTGLIPANNTGDNCLELRLSFNPFSCDCHLKLLKYLMHASCNKSDVLYHDLNGSNMVKLGQDKVNYKCTGVQGEQSVATLHLECEAQDLTVYFILMIVSMSISVVAMVASVIYRYRYHCYYWYIHVRANTKAYRELEDLDDYQYDAFISYNHLDTAWVVHKLVPILEGRYGLKLCIHDRDWIPGRDIIENILESIEKSRKTVMVVSNAYASSNWCQLELTMAQHQLFSDDRDNLVLILKEKLIGELITPRLALQMKQTNYIAWEEEKEMGQKVFWEKLSRSIKKPVGSVKHSIPHNT